MAHLDEDSRVERQAARIARGYLALAAGDAGRALRLLATDRLAETTRLAKRRRRETNKRFLDRSLRHG